MTPEELGRIIRGTRQALHLRQSELASVAGVGVRTLSEIENGKTTAQIGLVLKVLESLGVELQVKLDPSIASVDTSLLAQGK